MNGVIRRAAAAAVASLAFGCGNEMPTRPSHEPMPALASVSAEDWQRLAERRMFFAHQSVGANVIDGMAAVLRDHPQIPLRVIEISSNTVMKGPGLYHKRVGQNGKPATKLHWQRVLTGRAIDELTAKAKAA